MRSILLTAFLLAALGTAAMAQPTDGVPRTVSFQGRARDAAGVYLDGTRQMTVRIFDQATGGSSLFSETQTLTFSRGAFTVIIGGSTVGGIPEDLEFNQPLWLEVTINGFNGGRPLEPRMQFHSAPSAMNAQMAEEARYLEPGSVVEGSHFIAADSTGSEQAGVRGGMYLDNAPIAWALVNGDGTIISDYGIESVTRTGTGQYEIVLYNPAAMVPVPKGRNIPALAPIVQPVNFTDFGSAMTAAWSFRPGAHDENRHISVRTYGSAQGAPSAVDAQFSIVVFGRPE